VHISRDDLAEFVRRYRKAEETTSSEARV